MTYVFKFVNKPTGGEHKRIIKMSKNKAQKCCDSLNERYSDLYYTIEEVGE